MIIDSYIVYGLIVAYVISVLVKSGNLENITLKIGIGNLLHIIEFHAKFFRRNK